MNKTRVLFLCTGNSARSQMAEAFLRWHAADYFEVFSAGVDPKGMNPMTVEVMGELGIDMSTHRSKPLSEYIGKKEFDYLVTVCSNAEENCPIFPGMGTRLHWEFDDPASANIQIEQRLNTFRRIRDEIDCKVLEWLSEQGVQARR